MTAIEIEMLMGRINEIGGELDEFRKDIGERLSAIEHAAIERRARIEGRKDALRIVMVIYRSDLARWLGAVAAVVLLRAL